MTLYGLTSLVFALSKVGVTDPCEGWPQIDLPLVDYLEAEAELSAAVGGKPLMGVSSRGGYGFLFQGCVFTPLGIPPE